MYQRSTEQEAMKDAVEMAVLSAVQHPNLVQVFACLTDMVEEPGAPPGARAWVCVCVRAFVRACVCVSACVRVRTRALVLVLAAWARGGWISRAGELPTSDPTPHPHNPKAAKSYGDLLTAGRAGGLGASAAKSAPLPRLRPSGFRRLEPYEDPEDTETCNIVILEASQGPRLTAF
jgi:hypothetical protein